MKLLTISITAVLASLMFSGLAFAADAKTIHVVVLTGGHDYDQKMFPKAFSGHDDIQVDYKHQKDDSEIFEDVVDWKYDVIVLYNMSQKISPKRQENFLKIMDKGVGVVALHHNWAAYSDWPEYAKITGVRFMLKDQQWDGKQYKQSTYKHDVDMSVKVAAPQHPVTKGLKDFVIRDETYKGQWIDPQATVLLTTNDPDSDAVTAIAKTYRNARVCAIQHGHGPNFDDENLRLLLANAIRWAANPAQK